MKKAQQKSPTKKPNIKKLANQIALLGMFHPHIIFGRTREAKMEREARKQEKQRKIYETRKNHH